MQMGQVIGLVLDAWNSPQRMRLRAVVKVNSGVQEFNSVEAIKGAVQYGLGAAFVSSAAITKELDLGLFKRIDISGVRLSRTLSLVSPSCPLPRHCPM